MPPLHTNSSINNTLEVQIAGILFHVEQTAYPSLKAYLMDLKRCFPEDSMTIEDIETRMAEVLLERLNINKGTIDKNDIELMVLQVGTAKEIALAEGIDLDLGYFERKNQWQPLQKAEPKRELRNISKKFALKKRDKKVAGVASGIASYYNIDPAFVRLGFVASVFAGGFGMIGYKSIGTYDYDPEKAKALLKEAGWEDTDGDGILEKDGEPFRTTYGYYEEFLRSAEVAQVLQSDLRKVGVDLELKAIELASYGAAIMPERGENPLGLWLWKFNPSAGSSTRYLTFDFRSNPEPTGLPYEGNAGWYSNPDLDDLFAEAWLEVDQEKRAEKLGEIQEVIWNDAPWLWLYMSDLLVGVRENVHGVDVYPMSFLHLSEAWKEE